MRAVTERCDKCCEASVWVDCELLNTLDSAVSLQSKGGQNHRYADDRDAHTDSKRKLCFVQESSSLLEKYT